MADALGSSANAEETLSRSGMHFVFYGTEGLRAGWSLALFFLPFLLLYGVGRLVRHFHPAPAHAAGAASQMTPAVTGIGDAVSFGVCALVAFLISRLEKRPFGVYGLGGGRKLGDLVQGLFWGVVMLSLLVAGLRLDHLMIFDGAALRGAQACLYAGEWTCALLFVGFFEEFFFRGFTQFTAARGISGLVRHLAPRTRHAHAIGFWGAAMLFSVAVFALLHTANKGESPLGLVAVGAAGLTFAFSLWRTGTLWWAIGFHAAWDWAQSFLYGVADSGNLARGHLLATHPVGSAWLSGGTTGPEGSLFVLPTLALAAVVIHFTLPRRVYSLTPSQQPGNNATSSPFTLDPADVNRFR